MRKIAVLVCFFLFTSCEWFVSKEDKTQELVKEEMQHIDFNEVDRYPLFPNCDEMATKEEQKNCFETSLLQHLSATLQDFDFMVDTGIQDTIYVNFLLDKEGEITVLSIDKNEILAQQIPEFDGIVAQSFTGIPKIQPALKRGIPINGKYRIPIVLNSN